MDYGKETYAFDPDDAWDPDFPRCPLCEDDINAGQLVVTAGERREAHADCVNEMRKARRQTR
jgi:hypothetical protein